MPKCLPCGCYRRGHTEANHRHSAEEFATALANLTGEIRALGHPIYDDMQHLLTTCTMESAIRDENGWGTFDTIGFFSTLEKLGVTVFCGSRPLTPMVAMSEVVTDPNHDPEVDLYGSGRKYVVKWPAKIPPAPRTRMTRKGKPTDSP